jgi:ketosteroid isomerase-like protein
MGHPTDAEREEAAAPLVARFVAALEGGDPAALAACYAEGAVVLTETGRLDGGEEAAAFHAGAASRMPGLVARRVTRRQQQGAHAAVGWVGWDAASTPVGSGFSTVEIRRGLIVFESCREETAAA